MYINNENHYINLQVSIIDNGIGISEEGLKSLFIDFSRLEENSSRNKSGTGLGLSICKKIIEQMGGSVNVSSKRDEGTRFDINIKTKCIVKSTKFTRKPVKKERSELWTFISKDHESEELDYCIKQPEAPFNESMRSTLITEQKLSDEICKEKQSKQQMKQLIIHQQSIRSSESINSQKISDAFLPVRFQKDYVKTR